MKTYLIIKKLIKYLPNIDFSPLMNDDITEKTKKNWKYLQLVFFVIENVDESKSFGKLQHYLKLWTKMFLKKNLKKL